MDSDRPTVNALRHRDLWYADFEFELDEQPGLSTVTVHRPGHPKVHRCFTSTQAYLALKQAILFVEETPKREADADLREEEALSEIESLENELDDIDLLLISARERVQDLESRRVSIVDSIRVARSQQP